jgi:hypothetical protein
MSHQLEAVIRLIASSLSLVTAVVSLVVLILEEKTKFDARGKKI